MVERFAEDFLQNRLHNGERFDVAIVVHGRLAVLFEVERVDEVDVVQVGGGGFVGDVDGVFQRQVPDGERFKFRVARFVSVFRFVIELAETGRQFSRLVWYGSALVVLEFVEMIFGLVRPDKDSEGDSP